MSCTCLQQRRRHSLHRTDQLPPQAKETVTPDSQKSTLDKASETVTGKADNAAGSVQPEGDKSTTQSLTDTAKDTFNQATEQVRRSSILLADIELSG